MTSSARCVSTVWPILNRLDRLMTSGQGTEDSLPAITFYRMVENMQYLWGYLVLVNIVSFVTYGLDKKKAKKGAWRIPEHTLLMLAVIGGSIGALVGMKIFHHKTKKTKFAVGVPLILVLQMIGIYFMWTHVSQEFLDIIFI